MAEDLGNGGADHRERRRRQRFVAKRWGSVCFWIVINGQRLPLNDLSLEGFSLPAGCRPSGAGRFRLCCRLTAFRTRCGGWPKA
jgi:hypothetical protein